MFLITREVCLFCILCVDDQQRFRGMISRDMNDKSAYFTCYPSKNKTFLLHLYNVCPTSSTLVQHCTNVIQMFCVYWDGLTLLMNHYVFMSFLPVKGKQLAMRVVYTLYVTNQKSNDLFLFFSTKKYRSASMFRHDNYTLASADCDGECDLIIIKMM